MAAARAIASPDGRSVPTVDPTHATRVPPRRPEGGSSLVMPLRGPAGRGSCGRLAHRGVERTGRRVRFAR